VERSGVEEARDRHLRAIPAARGHPDDDDAVAAVDGQAQRLVVVVAAVPRADDVGEIDVRFAGVAEGGVELPGVCEAGDGEIVPLDEVPVAGLLVASEMKAPRQMDRERLDVHQTGGAKGRAAVSKLLIET